MSTKFVTSTLLASAAVALVVMAQMHGSRHAPAPKRIEIPPDGVTFPMQDFGGRPVVEVKIDGQGPYRFILDTGANVSVISEELNLELALKAPPGIAAFPRNGEATPAIVAISELRIGGAVLGDMIAAVMPVTPLLGKNAQGVLSAASFPGYMLTYDYPAKRISIMKGALSAADSQSIFEYSDSYDVPRVPIRVAGHDTEVTLDTGASSGLTLPTTFLHLLPLASEPKEASNVKLVGREFPASTARVNGAIELGKYKLDSGEVRFSDARGGASPAVGTIGYEVLRHFVMTLDSKNRRIRIAQ